MLRLGCHTLLVSSLLLLRAMILDKQSFLLHSRCKGESCLSSSLSFFCETCQSTGSSCQGPFLGYQNKGFYLPLLALLMLFPLKPLPLPCLHIYVLWPL